MAQADDGAELTGPDQGSRDGAVEGVPEASKGRGKAKAYAASSEWPNKSTGPMRADVLEVLGVLKVATPLQIQRITRPGASSDRFIRATLRDLELHQLVVCEGRAVDKKPRKMPGRKTAGPDETPAAETGDSDRLNDRRGLWLLRGKAGLQAASAVLEDSREMGGTASGAGKTGGGHALAVNESIIAFIHGGTEPGGAGGISAIGDWSTEAAHPLGGGRKVIPDALLRAPGPGVSVLMLELDRYGMQTSRLMTKCANYRELYRRQVRNDDPRAGTDDVPKTVPVWKQMYPGHGREGYPPLAIVFTGRADRPVSEQALMTRLATIGELTREYWEPVRTSANQYDHDSWLSYQDAIPVVATTLARLKQHGPMGPVWTRYGRQGEHSLGEALKNWDTRAAYDRRREAERARNAERQRELQEKRRCPTCGRHPDEIPEGTTHLAGKECTPCAGERRQRELEDWARRTAEEDEAREQREREAAAQRAADLAQDELDAKPLGLARALFRRAPKR